MKLKSYFSSSVAAAIEQARAEMGPDAMIVQSRKAPDGARHLGEFEVVVAQMPQDGTAGAVEPEGSERLSREVAEMRRQLATLHRTISRSVLTAPRWATPPAGLAQVFAGLLAAEVDSELAREIVDRLEPVVAAGRDIEQALAEEVGRPIQVQSRLGPGAGGARVVALVGPAGAGKTSTAVKLAMRYGLGCRKPVDLISMDNRRVGGAEQLRSFAAILGVGFRALETVGALAQALGEDRQKDLVLIDTPGFGARDMAGGADLAEFLARRPEIDTHLVLTASMKSADLVRVAEQFAIFRPAKLLFTRLDETEGVGTIYSLAARSGRPVSFLGTGQQIPEDLEEARRERLVELLLAPARRALAAA